MAHQANPGVIALNRFGYGARAGDGVAIAAADPRGFLRAEIEQPGIMLLAAAELPSTEAAVQQMAAFREARRLRKQEAASRAPAPGAPLVSASPPAGGPAQGAQPAASAAGNQPRPTPPQQVIYRAEAAARFHRAVAARAGFAERLVAFWANHFCVSAAKGPFGHATAGAFEREAIRPHVLGRFSDMLLAVESHPAMLHYLDNARSVGPNSVAGRRGNAGLNENLGREVMELHTLGVDGGYTQADVTALAKILTGWSRIGPRGKLGDPGAFVFKADAHEPGPIALLGTTYADVGVGQGRAALLDLAHHPRTAHHLAAKLARAFVADAPPEALVARLARVFHGSGGDLRAVALALVDAPEAWSLPLTRMRTPYELIVAAHRLLGRAPDKPVRLLGALASLGMPLWQPPAPDGFPTDAVAWGSPESLKLRLDYCAALAGALAEPPNPSELLDVLCGPGAASPLREAVGRAESRKQGLALLLMSPEMQRS